ncbi:MAG: DUF2934 domain-containing protein [Candidatus Sulfotelmatobacter sp.]|jgi:hypothetical protein
MARRKSPKNNPDIDQSLSPSNESTFPNPVEGVAAASSVTEVVKPKNGKRTRTPETIRAEARANLVPINLDDEIRCLAYLLSERRGFEPGHEIEDWLAAEREVLGRYQQQRA